VNRASRRGPDEIREITIHDIARMCGVSAQTVSRVINNRPDVSPATRSAILAAIAEVGFRPNAVARSLAHRRSWTIGIIASGLGQFGVAETLTAITDASDAAGYGLLVKEFAGIETHDVLPIIEFLVVNQVEGIICFTPQLHFDAGALAGGLPASCPPIVFVKPGETAEYTSIAIDSFAGASLATRHLIALGRQRIAHLGGPAEWREAQDRRDGWLAALSEAGLTPGASIAGDWSSASGESAFSRMLEIQPDMDGVVVGNDQMALGALLVAHRHGLRVPEDLAIVGFDGVPEAAQYFPPLTTIEQPLHEMGRQAVERLLREINGEPRTADDLKVVLQPRLVVRESAPSPKS
jgi:LacI family transcriptional regulator